MSPATGPHAIQRGSPGPIGLRDVDQWYSHARPLRSTITKQRDWIPSFELFPAKKLSLSNPASNEAKNMSVARAGVLCVPLSLFPGRREKSL
jgi:hypothetical protein